MNSIYSVKFKCERKNIYAALDESTFRPGDYVIVEADKGIDLGTISYKKVDEPEDTSPESYLKIKHIASEIEIEKHQGMEKKEKEAFNFCLEKIKDHELEMKLVDVEYQFDSNKITFFFTAEKRIDFRALVKDLASKYNTRIELRQIGVRDEARRIGGYGKCGLKLCCVTFIDEFEPISTQMAREQLLTGNPEKLSGLCGRLLCCLAYEYDMYKDELAHYPQVGSKIDIDGVEAVIKNIDIFNKTVMLKFPDGSEEYVPVEDIMEAEVIEKVEVVQGEEKFPDG